MDLNHIIKNLDINKIRELYHPIRTGAFKGVAHSGDPKNILVVFDRTIFTLRRGSYEVIRARHVFWNPQWDFWVQKWNEE